MINYCVILVSNRRKNYLMIYTWSLKQTKIIITRKYIAIFTLSKYIYEIL